jgi:hypothetical protein
MNNLMMHQRNLDEHPNIKIQAMHMQAALQA